MYRRIAKKTMKTISKITEKDLMIKVQEGVSQKGKWQKPLLLLTKNGEDYNYMLDSLNKMYESHNLNADPSYYGFVRDNNELKMILTSETVNGHHKGEAVDGHHPEVDYYEYLGGPLGFDETIHRYCVDLIEYDGKPVISFICMADKNCSVEDIPAWIKEDFEIALLQLDVIS